MTVDTELRQVPELWTVQRVLSWARPWLQEKKLDSFSSPRLEVELLLASVLNIDRTQLFIQLDRPLSKSERDDYKAKLLRRASGEPVAYILGYRDFYRHRFFVNHHVLIPRPDSELLVEQVVSQLDKNAECLVLEVGVGSGCLSLSVASECPRAQVEGWDISSDAIKVALKNQEQLEISNVTFLNQDALDIDSIKTDPFDLVFSNPPYIAQDERDQVSLETSKFEPQLALFPKDQDGLTFYRVFANTYARLLKPGGKLLMEIGFQQHEKVAQLFQNSNWQKIEIARDLQGHPRVLTITRSH